MRSGSGSIARQRTDSVFFYRNRAYISYKFLIIYIPNLTKTFLKEKQITSRFLQGSPNRPRRVSSALKSTTFGPSYFF